MFSVRDLPRMSTFTYKSRAHAVHERSPKNEDIYKTSECSLFVSDQLRMSTFTMPGSTCSPKRSTKKEYIYKGRELLFFVRDQLRMSTFRRVGSTCYS
jgi:hypothetical protein